MARITKQDMINNLQAEVEALKQALSARTPTPEPKAVPIPVEDVIAKLNWDLTATQITWLKEKELAGDFLVTVFQGVTAMAFDKRWMAKGSKNAQAANHVLVMARKAATNKRILNGFNKNHAWFRL